MADLDTVRALIGDGGAYVKDPVVFDASSASFQVPSYPLMSYGAHGVVTTLANGQPLNFSTNPFTVNLQTGVVTFTGTLPTAQTLIVEYLFACLTDAVIQAILDFNADANDAVRLAAADALDAMASSEAVIQKKIKLLDLDTDGPSVARALREHAKALRDLVFNEAESVFDIAQQVNDVPGWTEKVWKDWLRADS